MHIFMNREIELRREPPEICRGLDRLMIYASSKLKVYYVCAIARGAVRIVVILGVQVCRLANHKS